MRGFQFPVELKSTGRRKSAGISVEGGIVKVIVSNSISDYRIRELIDKRTSWIEAKLNEQSLKPPYKPKEYVSGETFPYLGRNYRLKVLQGDESTIKMIGGYLVAVVAYCEKNKQKAVK